MTTPHSNCPCGCPENQENCRGECMCHHAPHSKSNAEIVEAAQCNPGDVVTGWVVQSDEVLRMLEAKDQVLTEAHQAGKKAGIDEAMEIVDSIRNDEDVRAHQSNDNFKHYAVGALERVKEALKNNK